MAITLEEARVLIRDEVCSPQCLFGLEGGQCICRCGGKYHGELISSESISLVGRYFHTFKKCSCGYRSVYQQGQVYGQISENVYLVRYYSFFSGADYCEGLARVEDMINWQFYDSRDWMDSTYKSLRYKDDQHDRRREENSSDHQKC